MSPAVSERDRSIGGLAVKSVTVRTLPEMEAKMLLLKAPGNPMTAFPECHANWRSPSNYGLTLIRADPDVLADTVPFE